ncbi:MAG TPA: hypothetical protein EYH34_11295, partial [Planctomycetes bacterium]|nr:hypothetical protein [Planctomycetota bacterium]
MRRGTCLVAGLAAIVAASSGLWAQQAAPRVDDAWHVGKVAKLSEARESSDAAAAGPLKYLHIQLRLPRDGRALALHKFRVVDEKGKEVGELWGFNAKRSLLVFEHPEKWGSLVGLYLAGPDHREPLFVVRRPQVGTTPRDAPRSIAHERPPKVAQQRDVRIQSDTAVVPRVPRVVETRPRVVVGGRTAVDGVDRIVRPGAVVVDQAPERVVVERGGVVVERGGVVVERGGVAVDRGAERVVVDGGEGVVSGGGRTVIVVPDAAGGAAEVSGAEPASASSGPAAGPGGASTAAGGDDLAVDEGADEAPGLGPGPGEGPALGEGPGQGPGPGQAPGAGPGPAEAA